MIARHRPALLALMTLGSLILAFSYFHLTMEDAWISLRYAENLALGHGLVSDPLGASQQGFSDPLWVWVLALARRALGLDVLYAAKILGALCLPATAWAGIAALRAAPVLVAVRDPAAADWRGAVLAGEVVLLAGIGLSNHDMFWATHGLETTAYGLAVMGALALTLQALATGRPGLALAAQAVATASWLLRPEGLLNLAAVSATLALWAILARAHPRASVLRAGAMGLGAALILIGLKIAFDWAYFGDPVANPAHIKLVVRRFLVAIDYPIAFFAERGPGFIALLAGALALTPVLAIARARQAGRAGPAAVLVLAILGFLFSQGAMIWASGGDFYARGRFLVTHQPLMILVIALATTLAWRAVAAESGAARVWARGLGLAATLGILAHAGLIRERIAREPIDLMIPDARHFDRWWTLGFPSPYAVVARTGHAAAAAALVTALRDDPHPSFAISEHGYVPFAVNRVRPVLALDTMGLDQKEIAANYGRYPFLETYFANRDWILLQEPRILATPGLGVRDGRVTLARGVEILFGPYLLLPLVRAAYRPILTDWATSGFGFLGRTGAPMWDLDPMLEAGLGQRPGWLHGARVPGATTIQAGDDLVDHVWGAPLVTDVAAQPGAVAPGLVEFADVARVALAPPPGAVPRGLCLRAMGDPQGPGLRRISVQATAPGQPWRVLGRFDALGGRMDEHCFALPDPIAGAPRLLIEWRNEDPGGAPFYAFADLSVSHRALQVARVWFTDRP